MKLKKLFAGVVAAAMIATMSFPAFAATPESILMFSKRMTPMSQVLWQTTTSIR